MKKELRALTRIKAGEEITGSYIGLCQTRNERREQLKRGWFFECECVRCQTNDDYMVCLLNMITAGPSIDDPEDQFVSLNMVCDLKQLVMGYYCPQSAYDLIDLYKVACQFMSDQVELDRIFKRAENVILVALGHDYPLYQKLLKIKREHELISMFSRF